ncbi:mannitol dehydrogenase family protein [Silvibacterium sp.]|uniref:mannitol dehydrogenase family protein n=1 Tax=Silvibacterium sp. TaxID=1964179 RepID=UPI0039E655C0
MGCGSFHRAHQVLATQAAIETQGKDGLRWGIASVSMRRRELPDTLNRQNGLYTVLERSAHGTAALIAGALREAVYAPEDGRGVYRRIADPETSLVTLTITATGYHLDPASGQLDLQNPAILHDLKRPQLPTTAVGLLVQGLEEKRKDGGTPPVILCCDNLTNNGDTLRQTVLDFASVLDHSLSEWIARNVRFPNSMVDRIVPMTKPEDIAEACRLLGGFEDRAPVPTEPSTQWVIEEFEGDRPAWEAGGAEFVTDVRPFEASKLRMLNGVHMFLAYVGALDGKRTISEAAEDPIIGSLAEAFMLREQGAGVPLSASFKERYAASLMARFRNPGIVHMLSRIARNGSTKMSARILEPMRENLLAGRDVHGAILLIASWIRWFALHDQEIDGIHIVDPRAEMLHRLYRIHRGSYEAQAEAFLGEAEIFGPPLPDHQRIVREVAQMLHRLSHEPVGQVLQEALQH